MRFVNRAVLIICLGLPVLAAVDCPVVNPVLTYRPAHPYVSGPEWDGTVKVQMTISKSGLPVNLSVVQSMCAVDRNHGTDCKGADEISIKFVAQWKFKPATKCGEEVEYRATASVDFHPRHQVNRAELREVQLRLLSQDSGYAVLDLIPDLARVCVRCC
jgi:hypothetical protein